MTDLLTTVNQAAGASIGKETVMGIMELPAEQIKAVNRLLIEATQASGDQLGKNNVVSIIESFGILNTSANQSSQTITEILDKVENLGIPVTSELLSLIKESPYQNVLNAVSIYERVYSKQVVGNPSGLFYKILLNENDKAV